MRTIVLALSIFTAAGCSTPRQIQPAPPAFRDHKTPVALGKPSLAQRYVEERHLKGQIAENTITVEGAVVR